MPIKVKIIRARDFLQIQPEGKFDLEAAKQMLVDVAASPGTTADYEVLIDLRQVQWLLSGTEVWELVEALAAHEEAFRERIALLALPGAEFDHAERMEICSRGSGRQVRAFTNFEDSVHWLFEGAEGRGARPTRGCRVAGKSSWG
jgi:hypothetical protein